MLNIKYKNIFFYYFVFKKIGNNIFIVNPMTYSDSTRDAKCSINFDIIYYSFGLTY